MIDRAAADRWLEAYIEAWHSYDADAIAALFTDDVAYRYHPYDEPITGRDSVVGFWRGEKTDGAASALDAPGTFDARYRAIAVDGGVVVATGATHYRAAADGPVVRSYDNCFVMRFGPDGRCAEFTEWYVQRPGPRT